jgi:1,4-alpha-glucan branching enzyme
MKKLYPIIVLILIPLISFANESINPTIAPVLFRSTDAITVSYDVTGTPLASLSDVYIWVWIPGKNSNAKYNVNPASSDAAKSNNAKFTKLLDNAKTIFTITFTPAAFFESDISAEKKIGVLLKGNDWSNGQTTDYITDFWDGSFQIKLLSPNQRPLFVTTGDEFDIEAEAPVTADFDLFVNDVLTEEQDNTKKLSYTHSVTETSGSSTVKIVATSGGNSTETIFTYIISATSPHLQRPAGIIPGINYNLTDGTKVTLCLWAPGKTSVYALGDFSDWEITTENLMNKDGEHFWIEISNLTPGAEYGFQYLINESVFAADPYAAKILDPDDQYILDSTYPSLKNYPAKALHEEWYFNRVAVFQTNQQPYAWQATDFQRPEKENLVIYELLIRDFFGSDERTYANLLDTLSYLKRIGINAIELMPVMEFNGNESWGYNPTFMFAPDKSYGTRNQLKAFVDKCHQQGIAVILDIAMNHHDAPNPYVLMDFDFTAFKPTVTNKWFNVNATHPYNVFFDMNHESSYTKTYLDTVNYYWLHEFNIDGYRFDLSKGFTQTNNVNNVNAWGAYDAGRIALLKRMADNIWEHTPDAYVILEHFADNTEEKELAEYRATEGKGMMLWGNLNHAYNQNTMGIADNSDIAGIYHGTRNWSTPHVVGYMESHDEERLMYKNLAFGNSSGSYSVKTLKTSIERIKAASMMFYTIPGPKMLWQFGELGYDQSINRCENGSINDDCRVSPKPVKWNYMDDPDRHSLLSLTSDLIRLRNTYTVFTNGQAVIQGGNTLVKQITLKSQPYTATPATTAQMNVQLAANFNVTSQSFFMSFPHTGTWYDYYDHGKEFTVGSAPLSVTLAPGQYKLYTDVLIENPLEVVTEIISEVHATLHYFPNPAGDFLSLQTDLGSVDQVKLYTLSGTIAKSERIEKNRWYIGSLSTGLYIAEVHVNGKVQRIKICKK